MTSSVPFNPDDFEDNNPFAQANETITEPALLATTNGSQNRESQPVEEDRGDENEQKELLPEEELKKLLPERFTNKYQMSIRLTAIEKNKLGNPILKFDAAVKGLPRFRQAKYKDIRRTYNEVVKFNKYLAISNMEVFVPVIPLASTSYPGSGDEEIKKLMSEWQAWFDRITSNPILIRDEEFVFFIENDFGYSIINTNRKTSIASGLVRKTLKQLALPYDQYEELADFRPLIKSTYLSCQKLHKALDRLSKAEKQLSIYIFDLSNKLDCLSQFETVHPGMKNMWEKLGKLTQILSDLTLIECVYDMGTLGDGIQSMIDDFYEIKEALTNRYLIMRELLQAEAHTQAKHSQAAKIKSKVSLDPIKVDEAIRSLEYATKAEESLNLQVKRISGEMIYEKREVLEYTEKKFQRLLKDYTLNKVEHHRKILKHLENIRLDIRIVDEKGGLSRLNRDNLTNLKHNLAQSQSASGDSWTSRTFRSLNNEKKKNEEQDNDDPDAEDDSKEHNTTVDAKNAAHLLGVATF